jgi:ABC-type transporter Mla subunit MlaD
VRERKATRDRLKETDEKINALIGAQMRTEEAMASLANAQANLSHTQAELARDHANTDDKLNAFINTVERLISERRKEEPWSLWRDPRVRRADSLSGRLIK